MWYDKANCDFSRRYCMRKNNGEKAILISLAAALVLLTAFIWGHSAMPAAQSEGESKAVLPILRPLLLWFGVPLEQCHTVLRKMAHFSEYGLLGMVWIFLLLKCQHPPRRCILPAGSACLFTALVDETIQLFVPGRSGMVTDIWIDFAGASAGILGSLLLSLLIRHIRKQAAAS